MTTLDDDRISKFQRQIYDWLAELFPSMKIEMEKPIELNNQRIDIYVDNLNLAIECHGIQHYKPNFFVKSQEQWVDMVEKDSIKKKILEMHGITLIEIPYNHKLKNSEDLKIFIFSHEFNSNEFDDNIFKNKYEENQKNIAKNYYKNTYKEFKDSNKLAKKQNSKERYQQAKEWKKQNDRSK